MQHTNTNGFVSHLSYCSNIHPGETWPQVRANLDLYMPAVRQAMNPEGEFGIGLRLSADAARELSEPAVLDEFKAFLRSNMLYVFTINGFPYGPFHGTTVKEDVYQPDWKNTERLRYTNQLADVFAEFLPDGQTGSISTVPGAFKACVKDTDDVWLMTKAMVEHVAHLVHLEQRTGKHINLALEPEPCCFLETIDESVSFFTDYLFSPASQEQLAALLGVSTNDADQLLHKHLGLCLDLCHAAVEFENYDDCVRKLRSANVTIGKVQISSGLRIKDVSRDTVELLRAFDDNVYLHQVVQHYNGSISRYPDLGNAFDALSKSDETAGADGREWRVHFHVPVFLDDLGEFSSTQFFVREALEKHKLEPLSSHLEVETYTWNVLPKHLRTETIDKAILRELQWVRDRLT